MKISALVVTRDESSRLARLRRSLDDFRRQSHLLRELVVVAEATSDAGWTRIRDVVEAMCGSAAVTFLPILPGPPLGALRNYAMDAATGDALCPWDDDDRHHPERLAVQLNALENGRFDAVFLREVVHFFELEDKAYVTTWAPTPYAGHPGTPLIRRGTGVRYPEEGETARRGEDVVVHDALVARGSVGAVDRMPHLFGYVHHGANTWESTHHTRLAKGLALSRGMLARRESELRRGFEALALTARALEIYGRNGWAFTVAGVEEERR